MNCSNCGESLTSEWICKNMACRIVSLTVDPGESSMCPSCGTGGTSGKPYPADDLQPKKFEPFKAILKDGNSFIYVTIVDFRGTAGLWHCRDDSGRNYWYHEFFFFADTPENREIIRQITSHRDEIDVMEVEIKDKMARLQRVEAGE